MGRRRRKKVRRVSVAILVAALLVGITAPLASPVAAQPSNPHPVNTQRLASADRYSTSLEVARQVIAEAGGSVRWAVVVSGHSWTDAVVASSVAGALGAPVVLTPPNELRSDTARFLDEAGVSNVIVIGSDVPAGVSDKVVAELAESGLSVDRISASDRYATGVAVARRLSQIRQSLDADLAAVGSLPGLGSTAMVASGEAFADALVSGPVSAHGGHPVLLTPPDALDPRVAAYLSETSVEHVVLMGGTSALNASVEQALEDLGLAVTRLAGATRFETAVLLSELVQRRYSVRPECFGNAQIGIARARVPFDAFSAGPLLARLCAPLLLTEPHKTNPATQSRLDSARESAAAAGSDALRLLVFGGVAAISAEVLDSYVRNPGAVGVGATGQATCNGPARMPLAIHAPMYRATWSPDCSRMAYLRLDDELWVADGDGSNARRLLAKGTHAHSPAWSPDGSQVAFAKSDYSGPDPRRHIFVIGFDGSGERQLTKGEVSDNAPSWSPDGAHLVFHRQDGVGPVTPERRSHDVHLVVLDMRDGRERPLLAGGEHEFSPAWSPDGSRIAYTTRTALWVASADGTDARTLTGDGATLQGVTWSPDGKRVATVRIRSAERGDEALVVVADVSGIDEHLIPIPNLPQSHTGYRPDRAPQWSSDGRRMFLHLAEEDPFVPTTSQATNWIQFVAAPSSRTAAWRTCRLPSRADVQTTGFPLPSWAAPSVGRLRVAVLFVEFPGVSPHYTTEEESATSLAFAERYIERSSGGRLDVEFVPHHQWLRADHHTDHYVDDNFFRGLLDERISRHAVELADAEFDFSDIDIALVVMPSTFFGGGGNEGGSVNADGSTMRTIRLNHRHQDDGRHADGTLQTPSFNSWGRTAAHEIMHSLGLADLYWEHIGFVLWPIGHPLAPPPLPEGEYWAVMEFGVMELNGYDRVIGPKIRDRRLEMLAWSRWQLGWLDDDQVECVTADAAAVRLRPPADAGNESVMAVVRVSANSAIVVESRRLVGYDEPTSHTRQSVAAGERDPQYLAEGILVYTVTSARDEHPMSLAQDNGRGYLRDFPLLGVGDSVSVFGYTIAVADDDGTTHTATITKGN